MFRVLITESLAEEAIAQLRDSGECEVETAYGLSPSDLIARVGICEALIVRSGTRVSAEIIEAGANLRVIARAGSGVDNIDIDAATARGIVVTTAPDANTNAAAEMAIGLMLALSRNIAPAHRSLLDGRWDRSSFIGTELCDKMLGIIGYGRVGRRVGVLCASMGMNVCAYDVYPGEPTSSTRLPTVADVLETSDIVTLHAAAEDDKPIIDAATILAMKPGAMLINVGRGSLVDTDALVDALDRGQLSGAAIDVYDHEPPGTDQPLIGHPAVLHTPHLGASTKEARIRVGQAITSQTLTILRNEGYPNCVNPPT